MRHATTDRRRVAGEAQPAHAGVFLVFLERGAQITIPVPLRHALKLKPGVSLLVALTADGEGFTATVNAAGRDERAPR